MAKWTCGFCGNDNEGTGNVCNICGHISLDKKKVAPDKIPEFEAVRQAFLACVQVEYYRIKVNELVKDIAGLQKEKRNPDSLRFVTREDYEKSIEKEYKDVQNAWDVHIHKPELSEYRYRVKENNRRVKARMSEDNRKEIWPAIKTILITLGIAFVVFMGVGIITTQIIYPILGLFKIYVPQVVQWSICIGITLIPLVIGVMCATSDFEFGSSKLQDDNYAVQQYNKALEEYEKAVESQRQYNEKRKKRLAECERRKAQYNEAEYRAKYDQEKAALLKKNGTIDDIINSIKVLIKKIYDDMRRVTHAAVVGLDEIDYPDANTGLRTLRVFTELTNYRMQRRADTLKEALNIYCTEMRQDAINKANQERIDRQNDIFREEMAAMQKQHAEEIENIIDELGYEMQSSMEQQAATADARMRAANEERAKAMADISRSAAEAAQTLEDIKITQDYQILLGGK